MADNQEMDPNLAQILQTLASFAPPQPVVPQSSQHEASLQPAPYPPVPLPQTHTPPEAVAPYVPEQPVDPRLRGRPAPQHRSIPSRPQSSNAVPTIDSSGITEWKLGLRGVTKVAAQNPNFEQSVKKMIKHQKEHVQQWESGRERLIEEQVTKRENEKNYRAAISLPGILEGSGPLRTPEADQEELEKYDQKVYRASRQMVEAQSTELKRLGVPFFGLRPDLLAPDDAVDDKKVTKQQLLTLQRDMLQHLMDLYGD